MLVPHIVWVKKAQKLEDIHTQVREAFAQKNDPFLKEEEVFFSEMASLNMINNFRENSKE